jgi:hypothetical protein
MRDPQRHALRRPRVGPFSKLSEIRCFYSFSRFRRAHRACRCGCRGGRDTPMCGGDGGTNGCVVGGEALGVSGPQKPKFSSIWVEKRLRNGSGTAGETAEYRPRSRPALLLEVINDRGELYCHRTRHRGGRALPVPGCPHGRFPRRSRQGVCCIPNKVIYGGQVVAGLKPPPYLLGPGPTPGLRPHERPSPLPPWRPLYLAPPPICYLPPYILGPARHRVCDHTSALAPYLLGGRST